MDCTPPENRIASLFAALSPREGIPLPGRGQTLARWQLLSAVAATHGAVVIKLFEAHADALAILAEVAHATAAADTTWAIWAAEPPDARVGMTAMPGEPDEAQCRLALQAGKADMAGMAGPLTPVRLHGRKAWCSGAAAVSHALLTCRDEAGSARLALIDARAPGVTVTGDGWHAVGMRDTGSGDVLLDDCAALCIGGPGAYIDRPGFWHGGAGIAACWYGAVTPLARAVRDTVQRHQNPHAAAHLGAIDGELRAAAALLRETAAWIDAHPAADAFVPAMRVRAVVEAAARRVMHRAGNVLGAGPLCRDQRLAQLYADLPVFLRQSHAERDQAALGARLADDAGGPAFEHAL
ncbi:acyl-CoA dehydrogenase family protein [Cupriavidus sp. P-10]|uniref:acyl-CoA dehydrogenase family protein n=1 Tax=Cupriavidus sp. P-10 TaxID=2027911 RepID=UPI000E2E658F|nr:acyl-CoA dehydrogenase family protein [Cupriavidus sp. P-10]BDB26722.1 acyl-CoA dehydrogenase family protein [Cupriavidus sp. P-10]